MWTSPLLAYCVSGGVMASRRDSPGRSLGGFSCYSQSGLPDYEAVPPVTWITAHYPKSIGFDRWLGQRGWDDAEAIKHAAGDKGSKVHFAIGALLEGETVNISAPEIEGSKFLNPSLDLSRRLKELGMKQERESVLCGEGHSCVNK